MVGIPPSCLEGDQYVHEILLGGVGGDMLDGIVSKCSNSFRGMRGCSSFVSISDYIELHVSGQSFHSIMVCFFNDGLTMGYKRERGVSL